MTTATLAVFNPSVATGREKAAAQQLLASLGLYKGQIDGAWGGESQTAFAKFRAAPAPTVSTYAGKSLVVTTNKADADADGSPRAYGPNGLGLDYLENAKDENGGWCGIATDAHGKPFIQGANDPAPGYYVSTTSLQNPAYPTNDPRRYVDAEKYAGCVLPESMIHNHGCKTGDLILVERLHTGGKCWSFFFDVGPAVGEVALHVVEKLGGTVDAKRGGIPDQCRFTIYPGSGTGKILDDDALAARVSELGLPA